MEVACREEGVDARTRRALDRRGGGVDVLLQRPREGADRRGFHGVRNRLDGGEIARRGDRESRFHHVDAERFELERHAHLLVVVHRVSGRLFAVAERRVEYGYRVHLLLVSRFGFLVSDCKKKNGLALRAGPSAFLQEPLILQVSKPAPRLVSARRSRPPRRRFLFILVFLETRIV